MFDNIIGYDDIKKTLKMLVDVLNNTKKYKEIGSTIPHGLFIHGRPGVGKTTFVEAILKALHRKSFIVRKNKSDGDFINYMNDVFEEAKNNQPAVILLDDLDKYSETGELKNNEEYVAVQSLIDNVKDDDIFVIATANDRSCLPDSLTRSGRFDIIIELFIPHDEDKLKIFNYYLSNKKVDKNINIKRIVDILISATCADLEKVCNLAGLYAKYNNKDYIGMDELIKASLELTYDSNIDDNDKYPDYNINIAYHEAGHALIAELFEPESVRFVTICKSNTTKGFTIYKNNDYYYCDIKYMEYRVKSLLAGKAAIEVVYNSCDVGSSDDLSRAFNVVDRFFDDYCMDGFDGYIKNPHEVSESTKNTKDNKIRVLLTKYYQEVKELLIEHRAELDNIAHSLNDKKILFQDEIRDILKMS